MYFRVLNLQNYCVTFINCVYFDNLSYLRVLYYIHTLDETSALFGNSNDLQSHSS
jgi:hypothetical protein